MTEAPTLEHQYALAILRPNPMWIPSELDILLLEMLHFNSELEEQGIVFKGKIDCRDENIDAAINEIDRLRDSIEPDHQKILIKLGRETTITDPGFIDINGNRHARGEDTPFRQYFDGSKIENRSDMGHACGVCIDLEQERIYLQDPQGIPVKEPIREAFARNFPTFEIEDLQIKQQHDVSSCALITHHNLQRFAEGLTLTEIIDVEALRLDYIRDIERAERSLHSATKGEFIPPEQPTSYYDSPIYTIRYTPV